MIKDDDAMATRREAVKNVVKGIGYFSLGGLAWGGMIKESKSVDFVLRPPGAIPEKDFVKACIKCGLCVNACPYDTLDLATMESSTVTGTPYFKAREVPCYMCTDVPCVPPCPTGALDISLLRENDSQEMDINKAQMGLAVINKETCENIWPAAGIHIDDKAKVLAPLQAVGEDLILVAPLGVDGILMAYNQDGLQQWQFIPAK